MSNIYIPSIHKTKRLFGLFAMSLCASSLLLTGCGGSSSASPPSDLRILETLVGTGATVASGDTVTVHYTGYLFDGSVFNIRGAKFDSSIGKTPFTFKIGAGQVIQGWESGLIGMKVGGQRMLAIPSNLAYGSAGAGSSIPPNAALVFDVTLLSIDTPAATTATTTTATTPVTAASAATP